MTALDSSLARVLATVDYLRITVGSPDRGDLIACGLLVDDAPFLASVIESTMTERDTDRLDVAASLFVQGYAFRIASASIGVWLLDGLVVDTDPHLMSIALGRGRPNAVDFAELRTVDTDDSLATLHEVLIDGHIAPFLANVKRTTRIGDALLWSNVGAACESAFGAFVAPRADMRLEIRDRLNDFLGSGRPELRASGTPVHLGPAWAWERAACCLFYKTGSEIMCQSCSLLPDEQRQERYERILAEVEQ